MFRLILAFIGLMVVFGNHGFVAAYLEQDTWLNIELEHAINMKNLDEFTYRGNITIPSVLKGYANVQQTPLSTEEQQQLKILAINNQFYHLKAKVTYANGVKRTYLTINRACSIWRSKLNDELWLSIDPKGYVNAITHYTVYKNYDICTIEDDYNKRMSNAKHFLTDVIIKHTELAPVPDTATFVQKLERERMAREKGDGRDNRGFFAKYWMYIVPIMLLVCLSNTRGTEPAK